MLTPERLNESMTIAKASGQLPPFMKKLMEISSEAQDDHLRMVGGRTQIFC